VGPRGGLDAVVQRKKSHYPCGELNPGSPAIMAKKSGYIDCNSREAIAIEPHPDNINI